MCQRLRVHLYSSLEPRGALDNSTGRTSTAPHTLVTLTGVVMSSAAARTRADRRASRTVLSRDARQPVRRCAHSHPLRSPPSPHAARRQPPRPWGGVGTRPGATRRGARRSPPLATPRLDVHSTAATRDLFPSASVKAILAFHSYNLNKPRSPTQSETEYRRRFPIHGSRPGPARRAMPPSAVRHTWYDPTQHTSQTKLRLTSNTSRPHALCAIEFRADSRACLLN